MADVGTQSMEGRALPRVHWSAVFAGVLVALAAHIVLGLIGAALGFAAAPADSEALGAGAAVWGLLTPFVASLLGAWVATKLARRWDTAGSNLHGILVWSIGLIAGAIFLTGSLASGAMSAGTAASGNAGAVRRMVEGGQQRVDPDSPRAQANAERAEDAAGKAGAAMAGGAAMAAIAGLLGSLVGAALGRNRREGKKGLGWRIALQRTQEERSGMRAGERRYEPAQPYGRSGTPESRGVPPADTTRPEDPVDPYHH